MIQMAIVLVLVVVGVILFAKWHNSKGIDTLTQNLTHEKDFTKPKIDELIDSAKEADKALDQRADENKKEIKDILKDVERIEQHQKPVTPKEVKADKRDKEGGEDVIK